MTPCYIQEKFHMLRILFYVTLLGLLFAVAVFWCCICTQIEIDYAFANLMKSFLYLGIGFVFYMSKYPEKKHSHYYIQMCCQSHIWWHVLVFMNGFTLYWLLYDSILHMEKYPSIESETMNNILSY